VIIEYSVSVELGDSLVLLSVSCPQGLGKLIEGESIRIPMPVVSVDRLIASLIEAKEFIDSFGNPKGKA